MVIKNAIDQRQHDRVTVSYATKILCGNGSTDVEIENISQGGALFHARKRFKIGDMLTIIVTGVHCGAEFQESVPGRIITISQKGDQYSYGFKFAVELHPHQTPSLSEFFVHDRWEEKSFLRDPRYRKAERRG